MGSQGSRDLQHSAPQPVSGGIWRLHGAKSNLLLHSVFFLHCKVTQMSRTVWISAKGSIREALLKTLWWEEQGCPWACGEGVSKLNCHPKPDAYRDRSCLACLLESSTARSARCHCFFIAGALQLSKQDRGSTTLLKSLTLVESTKLPLHDAGSILLPAAVNTCWYN